jgi:hypothetical protein
MRTFIQSKAIFVACVSLYLSLPPFGRAETQPPDILRGTCKPSKAGTLAWDCSAAPGIVKCSNSTNSHLNAEWKQISGQAEATDLIKRKYEELGDLREFLQWFACQGFSTLASSQRPDLQTGEFAVTAAYRLSKMRLFPVPWYRLHVPWGGAFEVIFDKFGKVKSIKHRYTVN